MNTNSIYWSFGFVLLVGLIAVLFINFGNPLEQMRGNGEVEPYRTTLTGEYVCLPHKDPSLGTKECTGGIRTDSGEYYAIDFNLMSQEHRSINTGEHFSATGLVTPIELLSTDHWQKYDVVGIFSVTDSLVVEPSLDEGYVCTMDAMICPDGTAVGRQGPNCEFAACPSANATYSEVSTYLGGNVTTMNVSVSPQELISDSRCPQGVTCIWAGTVEVRTVLATPVAHGEHILTLGEPQVFGEHTVTLTQVYPTKTEATIPTSSYRFFFEIKSN